MISTTLLAADGTATPSKNLGGVTREIAAWPPGAGLDDFDWRVSMAEILGPGASSLFPDVERCVMVIEGRLRLTFDGETTVSLDVRSEPYAFPGDRDCHGVSISTL